MKKTNKPSYHRVLAVFCAVLMLFSCCGAFAQTAAAKPVPRDQVPYLGSTSAEVGCTNRTYSVPLYNASGVVSVNRNGHSWITSASYSGGRIYYTVSANTGTSNRYGSITVKNNGYTMTFSITQYAPIYVRYNNASGNALSSLSMDGATQYGAASRTILFINSAGTIRVSSNQSWLTLSLSGHYLTVTASPNYTGAARYATITVSNGKDSKTVSVTQKRYDPIYQNITYTDVPQPSQALKNVAAPFVNYNAWVQLRDNTLVSYSEYFRSQYGRLPATDDEYVQVQNWAAEYLIANYYMPLYYTAASFMGITAPTPDIYPMSPRPDGSIPAGSYDIVTGTMSVNLNMLWYDGPSTLKHTLHELHHVWQKGYARYNGNLEQYVIKYNLTYRNGIDDNDYLEKDAYHYADTLVRFITQ